MARLVPNKELPKEAHSKKPIGSIIPSILDTCYGHGPLMEAGSLVVQNPWQAVQRGGPRGFGGPRSAGMPGVLDHQLPQTAGKGPQIQTC